jgi:hypothetical protein
MIKKQPKRQKTATKGKVGSPGNINPDELLAKAPPELVGAVQRILEQEAESCAILFTQTSLIPPCVAFYTNK